MQREVIEVKNPARKLFKYVEKKSFAKMCAANLLAKDDPKSAADDLFNMMERSITDDSLEKQETTKEFIVLIIQIVNNIDKNYADEVTKYYLDKTVKQYMGF